MDDDLADRLTALFLEYHKGVVLKVKKERGSAPKRYKNMQIGWVRNLFRGIGLEGLTLFDQAKKLLSGLIVCHALPNTNHRTSIFFVQAFLRAHRVNLPHYLGGRSHLKRFKSDVNGFIRDSKYLIKLKVNQDYYTERYSQGKRRIYLGAAGRVIIRGEDLGLSNWQYNRRHRKTTEKWLERMLEGQSARYLKTPSDSLRRFIAHSES